MEKIKITFLGTANAIPTEKRNHSSILCSFKDENILIDCGENTQRQLRIAGISPAKITKILITHWHGDHILGLPGLLQTLAMSNYSKTLKIYGPRGTFYYLEIIKKLMIGFKINIEVREISGRFIDNKEFYIEASEMQHQIPCNAYSIVIKDRIRLKKDKLRKLKIPNSPLLKELQQGKDIKINNKLIRAKSLTYLEKGKKVSFILDTKMNKNAVKIAKDSDLLIAESTFSEKEQKKAKEYMHLTTKDAAFIANKTKSKKLILTHISQRYEHSIHIIEKEARKRFKNTIIAKDFYSAEI